jgi:CHAT domain-containing protein
LIKHEQWIQEYSSSQTVCAYEDFFAGITAQEYMRNATEATRTKLAFTLLFYAEALALADKSEESTRQIEAAKALLMEADTQSQHSPSEIPTRAQLLIDMVHAKLRMPNTAKERRNVYVACASRAEALKDWPIYRENMREAITQAYEAREAAEIEARAAEAKVYLSILKDYLRFEDSVVHSAAFLGSAVNEFGLAYVRQGASQLEDYLTMVKDFEKDFPDFSIPQDMVNLAQTASRAARDLGNREAFLHYHNAEQKWNDRCPWMVERSGHYVLKDHLPDRYSFRFWSGSLDDPTRRASAAVATDLVLRWIQQELNNNDLSETEAEELLQWARLREAFSGGDDPPPKTINTNALHANIINQLCSVLFGVRQPIDNKIWEPWFSTLKAWLQLERPPSRYQRLTVLKEIQITRYQQLNNHTVNVPFLTRLPHIQFLRTEAEKSLRLHREIRDSAPEVVNEHEILICQWQYAGAIKFLTSTWRAREEGVLTDDLILEAVKTYEYLSEEFDARDELINLHRALNAAGTLTWSRWQQFKSVDVSSCLSYFRRAEEVYRRIRVQDAVRNSSRALVSKDMLAERLQMPLLYSMARSTAMLAYDMYAVAHKDELETVGQANNVGFEVHRSEVLSWCQSSKARALTDVLGLEAVIPAGMMASIKESPEAVASLATEKTILHEMDGASLSQKVQLREKLMELRHKMRVDEPRLRPMMDMRAGSSLSATEMMELGESFGKDVVIVDWVVVFGLAMELVMLIYREGRLCHMLPLRLIPKKAVVPKPSQNPGNPNTKVEEGQAENKPEPPPPSPQWIRMQQIEDWVNDSLTKENPLNRKYEDDFDPSKELNCRWLLSLVHPLQEHTREGETLIFCPTRTLYRIPLHALKIGGTPIIERNPVVYIQSIPLVRFTMQLSRQAGAGKENVLRAVIFNTLGEDDKALQSVQRLGNVLGNSALTTSRCTKEAFAHLGSQADIVHAHGHVIFDENDPLPLKHHLVLGYPKDEPQNQLTADEICNIKFQPGALIMAMGCNSGRARQSDCDDLLGLTAAFHCAGAGTVVSTLWMIDADDCMTFASAFYAYIVEQLREHGDPTAQVDLAVAMQKGITAVRFDEVGGERDPYHWAGFVLHGSWKFSRRRLPS